MKHSRFPHTLYFVHHLPTNSYGSVYIGAARGLVCFTRPAAARRFARRMETHQNMIVEMTMADACEVAGLARLTAVVLADDTEAPVIHHLSGRKSRF